MNIHVSTPPQIEKKSRVGLAIADGDIHPRARNAKSLHPYLAQRWRDHMDTFGMTLKHLDSFYSATGGAFRTMDATALSARCRSLRPEAS